MTKQERWTNDVAGYEDGCITPAAAIFAIFTGGWPAGLLIGELSRIRDTA